MPPNLSRLRLEQTSKALEALPWLGGSRVPPGGWLRVVREALGRTQRQQAARLDIAAPTLAKSERAEAEGRITLAQLRKLAEGLDCEVAYTLVPRTSLIEQVERQAEQVARQEVESVVHSMRLEGLEVSSDFVKKQVSQGQVELLAGKWSRLWR